MRHAIHIEDVGDLVLAYFDGQRTMSHSGKSVSEALGNLALRNEKSLNLLIVDHRDIRRFKDCGICGNMASTIVGSATLCRECRDEYIKMYTGNPRGGQIRADSEFRKYILDDITDRREGR